MKSERPSVEWITLSMLLATYLIWALGTSLVYDFSPLFAIVLTGIAIAQFSSLQHEALHGHPFRNRMLNEAMVFPGLTLTVPYGRFRDTHLAHHNDPILTDPYDDPESNYFDPAVWNNLSRPFQAVLRMNNTLLGRIVLGPFVGNFLWLKSEAKLIGSGDRAVIRDWLLHLGGVTLVAIWLWFAAMPIWAYLLSAWIGHGLLKIRTFLEHRAHVLARARTVVVEDRGPLALLFLNNNLHAVHHRQPNAPWYRLPALYAADKEKFLRRNDGYVFASYAEIFRKHFFHAKDPVPHPLMQPIPVPTVLDTPQAACEEGAWKSGSLSL